MRISLQVALGYFLIVGLAGWLVLNVFVQEVKPGVREAMEDTLVDAANLLAELAAPDLQSGNFDGSRFAGALAAYGLRDVEAGIWNIRKQTLDYRVYVTDHRGQVVFSTDPEEVGRDYSRWNDVHLTLRGRYGARSTREDPDDESTSVMHVAAPVMDGERIIGVVTVAKPNVTVQPFIARSQAKIRDHGLLLLLAAGLIGALFTWHLTSAIERMRRYARDVAEGRRSAPPQSSARELADLGRALTAMRERLEGKQYVERYVHTLTHEMKSPLAAIRGAAELLAEEGMPAAERQRFLANIREQEERLRQVADRMLDLARVEQQQVLQDVAVVDLAELLQDVAQALQVTAGQRGLELRVRADGAATVQGEGFLLRQVLVNLVDNAIAFSPDGGRIDLRASRTDERVSLSICDQGPGIPEYALDKVFERFFSLPRQANGKKSTGLGLNFVREVAQLHGGTIALGNRNEGGACATLSLPAG